MLGYVLIASGLGAMMAACAAFASLAFATRNLDADGEVLWPANDRSWG